MQEQFKSTTLHAKRLTTIYANRKKTKKNHIWEGRERGGEKLKNTLKDEITVGMAMQIP